MVSPFYLSGQERIDRIDPFVDVSTVCWDLEKGSIGSIGSVQVRVVNEGFSYPFNFCDNEGIGASSSVEATGLMCDPGTLFVGTRRGSQCLKLSKSSREPVQTKFYRIFYRIYFIVVLPHLHYSVTQLLNILNAVQCALIQLSHGLFAQRIPGLRSI